jgi:hypothetical protein
MKNLRILKAALFAVATWAGNQILAQTDYVVLGTDAIWLAGRTDIANPGTILARHGAPPPENLLETFPTAIAVGGGDSVIFTLNGGGVSYFNGFGAPVYGVEGNDPTSDLAALGAISGYQGPEGALVGVFLDANVPNAGAAPGTIDFRVAGATDFTSISPGLGQVFFIGDGRDSLNNLQQFIAPGGATRLFLGIPDGFGFLGAPGAYEDNDGNFRARVVITPVPEASTTVPLAALGFGIAAWQYRRYRRSQLEK